MPNPTGPYKVVPLDMDPSGPSYKVKGPNLSLGYYNRVLADSIANMLNVAYEAGRLLKTAEDC